MFTILVADDEPSMTEFLEIMLVKAGYEPITVSTAEDAMATLETTPVDLVISDISMPQAGGMAVLKKAMEVDPDLPVIMITAYASTESAVQAMKIGAYDYITKPFNIEEIKLVIEKALERRNDKAELKRLKGEASLTADTLGELLGRSAPMQALFAMIRKVATSRSTILITGESGVGKELAARAIHYFSNRKDKPFQSINCSAMPEQLLESELFGHHKGSFTGAHADKKGLIEATEGGTFFLDEVGDAPLSVQVKMLRVLQEREFRRVGGVKDMPADIRVVAATNQDLEAMIEKGMFREDFYYRLNIIHIHIPPLRERREDIPILVSRFIDKYAAADNRKVNAISVDAMRLLERHEWRGNVRELENVIERAVVLTTGPVIEVEHLPEDLKPAEASASFDLANLPDEGVDLDEMVSQMEKQMLTQALLRAQGVKKEAARLVNLSFRSFRYKLAKYGLGSKDKDTDEE